MTSQLNDAKKRAEFLKQTNELLPILRHADHATAQRAIETQAEAVRQAFAMIETLEAELRTKTTNCTRCASSAKHPNTSTSNPDALQIVPGPPTLIQRIKAAIAAFKGNHATRQTNPQI